MDRSMDRSENAVVCRAISDLRGSYGVELALHGHDPCRGHGLLLVVGHGYDEPP